MDYFTLIHKKHNSTIEEYLETLPKIKSIDCILYSEDGAKFKIRKGDIFALTLKPVEKREFITT